MQGFFDDDSDEKPKAAQVPSFLLQDDKADSAARCGEEAGAEEEDPLDAFMADVQSTVRRQEESGPRSPTGGGGVLVQDEADDPLESFLAFKEEHETTAPEADVEVDEDGNRIDLNSLNLAPLDHASIRYDGFKKNIFAPSSDTVVDAAEAEKMRKALDIRVRVDDGIAIPPISPTMEGLGLSHTLTQSLMREFDKPTPIQMQTVPTALSGHDIIGIAKTGSGKTGAFLWPVIHHISQLGAPAERGAPIAIIVAPTRELAKQIYEVCRQWVRPFNFTVVSMFGGSGTMAQVQALREPCEIVVGTPGRIIHFLKKRHLKSHLVKCLCLDEADKMLDMGFENQVRSICGQLRPDRLTLMFSATFKPNVQRLARDLLLNPIRINVGAVGAVNKDIDQIPIVLREAQRTEWLLAKLPQFVKDGSVLIFVGQKHEADSIAELLSARGFQAAATHGEKSQQARHKIHFAFKNGNLPVLVATDLASRGLDIGVVKTVVQYSAPKNLEVHTHRVGRTGRAGVRGSAYSLVTEPRFAALLVASMQQARQRIPPDLERMAQQYKGKRFAVRQSDADDTAKDSVLNVHSGSNMRDFAQARHQSQRYMQGAGLGAERSAAPKRRRPDEEDDEYRPNPMHNNPNVVRNEFYTSFVPESKK